MTDQHFTVLDMGNAVKRKDKPAMAGILGLEIFERMAVTVDEPGGTLTIEPFRPGRPCEGDKIPLLFDDDQPSVAGNDRRHPGADRDRRRQWRHPDRAVALGRSAQGRRPVSQRQGRQRQRRRRQQRHLPHASTTTSSSAARRFATWTSIMRRPRPAISRRAPNSMNLGRALLQKYAVRFDYAQGHMCVMPRPKA